MASQYARREAVALLLVLRQLLTVGSPVIPPGATTRSRSSEKRCVRRNAFDSDVPPLNQKTRSVLLRAHNACVTQ